MKVGGEGDYIPTVTPGMTSALKKKSKVFKYAK